MESVVVEALALLRRAGTPLQPGLRDVEVAAAEQTHGFRFAADHRALLQRALPVGPGWVDWRGARTDELARRLAEPARGIAFDVEENAFWPRSWGPRPADLPAALELARRRVAGLPRLVPLFGHRFVPAEHGAPGPSPVFSVHQTDVVCYGVDLADYLAHELGRPRPRRTAAAVHVTFWSDLAAGADDADL